MFYIALKEILCTWVKGLDFETRGLKVHELDLFQRLDFCDIICQIQNINFVDYYCRQYYRLD